MLFALVRTPQLHYSHLLIQCYNYHFAESEAKEVNITKSRGPPILVGSYLVRTT